MPDFLLCFLTMNEATATYIENHLGDSVRNLALKSAPNDVDKALALQQITARQLLKDKVPSWAQNSRLLFPPRLNVEQCSSELTANYKASLIDSGTSHTDLTGGMGIDCCFLSRRFRESHYVEMQETLCNLMSHNAQELGAHIVVHNTTAEEHLASITETQDLIFIDPARRNEAGMKTVLISQCTPNIEPMWDEMLNKGKTVMVKLSPMLDIQLSLKALSHIKEVHVVAVDGECKELLLIAQRAFDGKPSLHCVELGKHPQQWEWSTCQDETPYEGATELKRYLFEPDVTIMKAGMFNAIANRFQLGSLDPNTHLLTGDESTETFFGHRFEIDEVLPFNKHAAKILPDAWKKANVTTRNFPVGADQLRKQLKISGFSNNYIFGVTFQKKHLLLLCHKL